MTNVMRWVCALLAGFGFQAVANAYSTTATITVDFGGSASNAGADAVWTAAAGPVAIGTLTNLTYLTTLGTQNVRGYYNSDFTSNAQCAQGAGIVPEDAQSPVVRKYGCRYVTGTNYYTAYSIAPEADSGPVGRAVGAVSVTDTTMTGVLTIVGTTDEPTGATTVVACGAFIPPPATSCTNISNSVGNGTNGYNYRFGDGSPFGSAWYGTTTGGTYSLNLTGTFTATSWKITGGTARYSDNSLACQDGLGVGGDARGSLCTASYIGGGFDPTGGHLSWGMDTDGAVTGAAPLTGIEVRSADGTILLDTLSGVLADLSLDASGNITTNAGEFRRAWGGTAPAACFTSVRYNGTHLTCGTALTAGKLVITGKTVGGSYLSSAVISVDIGGNSSGLSPYLSAAAPYSASGDVMWTQYSPNALSTISNSTYLSSMTGYNALGYYNPDFVGAAACNPGAGIVPPGSLFVVPRKYGCRFVLNDEDAGFPAIAAAAPIADIGPAVARAVGRVFVSDATLTGVLTVVGTTDEPTGGTGASVGNGLSGFNYRLGDGSIFSNAWQGITAGATFILNLTGIFNSNSWQVTGGTAAFADPGYLCSQTAQGLTGSDLCIHPLSWGLATGIGGTVSEIEIDNPSGTLIHVLSGVLANLTLDSAGNISTNAAEFRRAVPGTCGRIVYDGTRISCGTFLTAGKLLITGFVDADGDSIGDGVDNCPTAYNSSQANGDGDVRGDACDNCRFVSNPTQLDANQDGYGNICDADINNSGTVTATDFNLLRSQLNQSAGANATAAASDMNGSGTVTATDFNLLRARLNQAIAGQSGLVCAGTIPCPSP